MFTCPEKSIHSIYLDGELPSSYLPDYEAHVATCQKCKAELAKLKGVHSIFAADSSSIALSKNDMDSGFDRLQARLSYTRTTRSAGTLPSYNKKRPFYFVAGIAAAAVFALILPVRLSLGTSAANNYQVISNFKPVVRASFASSPTATLDKNFVDAQMTGLLVQDEDGNHTDLPFTGNFSSRATSAYVQTASSTNVPMATYDVFTPLPEEFLQEANGDKNAKSKDFNFTINSPFANISLEMGSEN